MTSELHAMIAIARERLDDIPDGITFADFPPGSRAAAAADYPGKLGELLGGSDGPRCQAIVIYPSSIVNEAQYLCEEYEGGGERWFCFGHVEDNPLLIERNSGHVYQFPHPVQEWRISDHLEFLSRDVPEFFNRYAMGEQYLTVAPGRDRWYDFMLTLSPRT
ncbi:hypothetical protein [Streptomyces sp. NPDC050422]|uniref:hypothetical protein n=1 Tax=Streptomyces sp. NPDC050422 TaxID=3365614 RepID=UPI0037A2439A